MNGKIAAGVVLAPVRLYRRYLSPLKAAPSCRFHPTCSEYAIQAVETHGALKGLVMATWRVLRCHPFNPGGYDPVPPRDGAHRHGGGAHGHVHSGTHGVMPARRARRARTEAH